MQRSTLSDCTESVLYQLLDLHYFRASSNYQASGISSKLLFQEKN